MLLFDFYTIGNRLHAIRKRLGLTQSEVAEVSKLSERTYADIERGAVNMRIETLLRICKSLHITPNEVLVQEVENEQLQQEQIWERLNACNPKDKETALQLLDVFLRSLK